MKTLFVMLSVLAVTGCASIAGEKLQPVTVQTTYDSQEVRGIGCTLKNDTGSWTVTSPASVMVHKSTGDMTVDCTKDNLTGQATLVSKSNGAVWGNIILGGGIGYLVDRNTGAGFDYPANITIVLRKIGEAIGLTPAAAAVQPATTVEAAK